MDVGKRGLAYQEDDIPPRQVHDVDLALDRQALANVAHVPVLEREAGDGRELDSETLVVRVEAVDLRS